MIKINQLQDGTFKSINILVSLEISDINSDRGILTLDGTQYLYRKFFNTIIILNKYENTQDEAEEKSDTKTDTPGTEIQLKTTETVTKPKQTAKTQKTRKETYLDIDDLFITSHNLPYDRSFLKEKIPTNAYQGRATKIEIVSCDDNNFPTTIIINSTYYKSQIETILKYNRNLGIYEVYYEAPQNSNCGQLVALYRNGIYVASGVNPYRVLENSRLNN